MAKRAPSAQKPTPSHNEASPGNAAQIFLSGEPEPNIIPTNEGNPNPIVTLLMDERALLCGIL